MNTFINVTPHTINLTTGEAFESQCLARVSASFTEIIDGLCQQQYGAVDGLPEPIEGVMYIVSGIVLSALKGVRNDVCAPASGHPDVVRNSKGHIVSVPCFVVN